MVKKIELTERRKRYYIIFHFYYKSGNIYAEKLKEAIKKMPGRKFNWESYKWETPLNLETIDVVNDFCNIYGFETPFEFKVFVRKAKELKEENEKLSKAEEADFKPIGLKLELKPFQVAGPQYILKNKRVILGDEQGLGKTPQAIAVFQYLQKFPVIIICPNTLKWNWFYEILKWTDIPEDHICVYENKKTDDFTRDIIIINYEGIRKCIDVLKKLKYDVIIMDESHYIKKHTSQRSKAAFTLSRKIPYRMLLTGTPAGDKPLDLIQQLKIIDKISDFGGAWNFKMKYCDAKENYFGWDFSGASNLEELHNKLRQICYVRRNKKEVLKELPDKQRSIVYLDINNKREYQKAKRDLTNFLLNKNNNINIDDQELSMLNNLKKKADYIDEVTKVSKYEALIKTNYLRQLAAAGKLKNVIEWIETFLASGEKLVVFAVHIKIIEALSEHFKCNKIYGGTKIKDRQKYVNDFQENLDTKLLILNIESGSTGITLTAASNLAVVELSWMPDHMLQLESRCHRIGQTKSVNIYYLLGKNTIDVLMYNIIEKKKEIVDAINAGITYKAQIIEEQKSVFQEVIQELMI